MSKQGNRSPKGKVRREQPRKDNRQKRVNFDNERESKFRKEMEKDARMESDRSNDISWYARNPEMLKAAASIAWSATTGLPMAEFSSKISVPGVMSIQWSPVVGAEFNAPLTQVMNEMYSFVVHANSRNTKYNSPDMMAVILAGSSAFAGFALGVRAYGTARLYSQLDYYTPDALLRAQGFDPSNVRKNLSRMWFDLNELSARLTQIWIPNTMPLLERWFWLCSNIYRDGDSAKAQYYLFTPNQLYQFGIVQNSSGCTPVIWGSATAHTWDAYMQWMNNMIDALLNDEDRGIMMGDILKAYGADKLFAVNPISADYRVEPVYDREVLTQIENLSIFAHSPSNIVQDSTKATLIQDWPKLNNLSATVTPPSAQILNFHQKEAPTPEQIMIATRLKVSGAYIGENTGAPSPSAQVSPDIFGTEIVGNVVIYYYDWTSGSKTLTRFDATSMFAQSSSNAALPILNAYLWSTFDWAPWMYIVLPETMPTTAYQSLTPITNQAIGDYDNYIVITGSDLRKLHRTAVYSEFGVPVL